MNNYIFQATEESPHLSSLANSNLWNRNRLVVHLLSRREAVRVLYAPALYGKTVLALQYAQTVFDFDHVAWIDAQDPRFVCDLDNSAIVDKLMGCHPLKLVVIDGVDDLSPDRLDALCSLVSLLGVAECEVLLTTNSAGVRDAFRDDGLIVEAHQLLFNDEECTGHRLTLDQARVPLYLRVPVLLGDTMQGRRRFTDSLVGGPVSTRAEAVAALALVVSRASVAQLDSFLPWNVAEQIDTLERSFPHAGIRRMRPSFEAFPLSAEERLRVLDGLLNRFSPSDAFENEPALIETLADLMLELRDYGFLALLLETYLGRDESLEYCSKHDISKTLVGQVPDESLAGSLQPVEAQRAVAVEDEVARALGPVEVVNTVEVRLFGSFELLRDGEVLADLSAIRKKAKVLIALLVVNYDKELPRIWVERAVWPESRTGTSKSSFYNLWSYVRSFLASTDDELRLSRSCDTVSLKGINLKSDVIAVGHLCDVLSAHSGDARVCEAVMHHLRELYRGPLLPGVVNPKVESYREAYQNRVLDALVSGTETLFMQGEVRAALRYASFAFQIDPTREDVCFLYMNVQKHLGQLTSAISTFMNCRRALVERFGIDGSRRLESLYEEILKEVS